MVGHRDDIDESPCTLPDSANASSWVFHKPWMMRDGRIARGAVVELTAESTIFTTDTLYGEIARMAADWRKCGAFRLSCKTAPAGVLPPSLRKRAKDNRARWTDELR